MATWKTCNYKYSNKSTVYSFIVFSEEDEGYLWKIETFNSAKVPVAHLRRIILEITQSYKQNVISFLSELSSME